MALGTVFLLNSIALLIFPPLGEWLGMSQVEFGTWAAIAIHELFGRLILEMNQAGLSWITILKKQENFRAAYSNFNIDAVAAYDEMEVERLKQDAGIIRNRLKILAAIHNAQAIKELQKDHAFMSS